MSYNNMNVNKREKRFKKDLVAYKNHPNYKNVKELYLNDVIKTIVSAEKQLKKIKLTNKGLVYKASLNNQNKLIEKVNKFRTEQKNQKLQQLSNNKISERSITLDYYKIIDLDYGVLTHDIEFSRLRKESPNCYYVQVVKFYDKNNNLINKGEFKTRVFDYIYLNNKQYKNFITKVNFVMTVNGSDTDYIPRLLLENKKYGGYGDKSYTVITTTAYKLQTKNLNIDLNQIYKNSDSGHCVYDAFQQYFYSLKEINKNAKAIYNKLISDTGLKFKKSYTDENINELALFCNSTLVIKDLINGKDKVFKNENARFYIELLNTKYNHLDLLQHRYKDITEVDEKEYLKIKENIPYYIEKNGVLITTDKTYKIKSNDFNDVYNEWKEQYGLNELFIYEDSKVYNMIGNYDNTLHTFFTDKFEVKNNLYKEIDLIKAYYNYSDINQNKFYNGIPSGSFINYHCDDTFDITTFNKLNDKNLIGFFNVSIMEHLSKSEHLNILGLKINSCHVFTSAQITLLKDYVTFKFIDVSYAPSVHIPFNDKFLRKIESNKKPLSYYCKAYGLLLRESSCIDVTIKPLDEDKDYYNLIDNELYDIFSHDGLIKIIYKNKEHKSYVHIAKYIHSYTRTLIIDQLLKMDINQVFGVKLDSIVIKKDYEFNYNDKIFSTKEAKIEKLLKDGITIRDNNIEEYGSEYSSETFGHFKPYFTDHTSIFNYPSNLLYNNDIITNRILYIGGAGGTGKTSSLLRNLENKNVCYTTSCWNLIQGQKNKFPNINGYSLPNLIGSIGTKKTEKIRNHNIKYIIIDELTLIDSKNIQTIINDYKHCFIFLLGDVDEDGTFYQCTLPTVKIFKPSNNIQYTKYTKSYRFDDELNNKLNDLREFMKVNINDQCKNLLLYQYVLNNFKMYDKNDIEFNKIDVGISAVNDYENGNELTNYFINKGAIPQYFIKTTNKNLNQLKGQQLETKPTHNNYECKLFKTIHSFQGLDLTDNNKIIISITKNFDYNLYYTAFSRARRVDQIILLK